MALAVLPAASLLTYRPQSQTTASTEPDLQNHEASNSPTVNGTVSPDGPEKNKTVIDIAEDAINSASVSVSGGSDTEASTAKAKDPNHVRTSSTVKKPQSFKSVSVNRSFLGAKNAASATSRSETSSPALTPAAPATTAGSSASKLKLVAKSGSSLGGASKTLTSNSKAPGPPDGSTVWNRNQRKQTRILLFRFVRSLTIASCPCSGT